MSNLYLKNTHLYYTYWNIIRIFVARIMSTNLRFR